MAGLESLVAKVAGDASGKATGQIMGLGQVIAGVIKQKQANRIKISEFDSDEVASRDLIRARVRAFQTGSALSRVLRQGGAVNAGISRKMAFSSGYAMKAGLSAGATSFNNTLVNLIGTNEALQLQNQEILNRVQTRVSQRALEVRMLEKSKKEGLANALINTGMENIVGTSADKDMVEPKKKKKSVLAEVTEPGRATSSASF
jgi:hypothetical protein